MFTKHFVNKETWGHAIRLLGFRRCDFCASVFPSPVASIYQHNITQSQSSTDRNPEGSTDSHALAEPALPASGALDLAQPTQSMKSCVCPAAVFLQLILAALTPDPKAVPKTVANPTSELTCTKRCAQRQRRFQRQRQCSRHRCVPAFFVIGSGAPYVLWCASLQWTWVDGARFFADRALRYPRGFAASHMLAPSTVAGLPLVGARLITERALGYSRSLEGMLSRCSGRGWMERVSLLSEHSGTCGVWPPY